MTVVVTHTTPADGSFSATGAAAWDANHTLTGVGTMAEQNANTVAITGGSVNGTTVGATTASTGAFTTLSASSTVSGTGFSTYLASPPAIGGTAAAAGTFTTLIGGADVANYGQLTGGATTKAVEFKSLGTDTNVAYAIRSKGTGAIDLAAGSSGVNISNGGTVTAVTRSASGSNYTTNPTPSITAPTTAGGVQAIATCTISCGSATVSAGGSGYVVGEILTVVGGTNTVAAVLTVATVSGTAVATVNITTSGTYTASPTNPAATTSNLSGTGATFTLNFSVSSGFTITNAGSGYVEQPTVTFSGGGGSGAAAYATVGATPVITSLANNIRFANAGGLAFQLGSSGTATVNYLSVQGSSAGNPVLLGAAGSDGNIGVRVSSLGTSSVSLFTNNSSQEALRAAHTASAVNYVQVTGATTASKIVAISAQGSDTDVTLSLSPKGAGTIRFGTYTGTILTPTGYITITDSGGTSRRLLVG
jgi:hypothetical protein